MSVRGVEFAVGWVEANINSGPKGPIVQRHVVELLAAAQKDGISREEIEDDVGRLETVIAYALDAAIHIEVAN